MQQVKRYNPTEAFGLPLLHCSTYNVDMDWLGKEWCNRTWKRASGMGVFGLSSIVKE